MSDLFFKKCSSCKKEIAFNSSYYVCSVSSCNGKRTGLSFCSVHCFERHVPMARHKDAAAIEEKAPTTPPIMQTQSTSQQSSVRPPQRRIVSSSNQTTSTSGSHPPLPKDVLIVASKLKSYINAKSEMNTSASVMNRLSDKVRRLCDEAIEEARADGRKTVLDRDFK